MPKITRIPDDLQTMWINPCWLYIYIYTPHTIKKVIGIEHVYYIYLYNWKQNMHACVHYTSLLLHPHVCVRDKKPHWSLNFENYDHVSLFDTNDLSKNESNIPHS